MKKKLILTLFIFTLILTWVFAYSQSNIEAKINKIFDKKDKQFNQKYKGAYNICLNEQRYYKKITNVINKVINLPKYKRYKNILNIVKNITEKKSQICTIKIQIDLKKYTFIYRPMVDLENLTPLRKFMFEKIVFLKFSKAIKEGNNPNLTSVSIKLSSLSAEKIDLIKKVKLKQISTALEMYFNDYWRYPSSLDKLVPTYLSKLPLNPENNKSFYYKLLRKTGATEAWSIIWAKMWDPKDCNVNVYSEQELEKVIKENDSDTYFLRPYLDKIKKNNIKFSKWCYYVILN